MQRILGSSDIRKWSPEYDSVEIHFLQRGEFRLELIEKKTSFPIQKFKSDYDINKESLRGMFKFGFQTDDINALYEKLMKNGVKERMGITHDEEFDVYFFLVEDLDENKLQFFSHSKH
jgi:hypothetical protein